MIEASITVHDRNSAVSPELELMHTKHQFSFRSNRAGDTAAELQSLIDFLEKLRIGNGGEPNRPELEERALLETCMSEVVFSLYRARWALRADAPGDANRILSEAISATDHIVMAYFPKLSEAMNKARRTYA